MGCLLNAASLDKNAPILYVLVSVILLVVVAQAVFFLVRAYRRGVKIGMEKAVLNKTMLRAAIFTIAPAMAILVGIVVLAKELGIPLPWLRLSVIGSFSYETIAASVFKGDVDNGTIYVTIALVMTCGMLVSMFLPLITGKKIQRGLIKIRQKDKKWGEIFMTALFLGMISAFLGYIFGSVGEGASGWIPVCVFFVSAVVMAAFGGLLKITKWKWINDYALPVCIVAGMAAAVPITMLLG